MISPAQAELRGPRTTALLCSIAFAGLDLTGASFRLQVRLAPGTPGSPLIDLATVTTAAAEGVRLIGVASGTSTLGLRINKSTMAALPAGPDPAAPLTLAWDLLITPAGGIEERYMMGPFTVDAGVTQ